MPRPTHASLASLLLLLGAAASACAAPRGRGNRGGGSDDGPVQDDDAGDDDIVGDEDEGGDDDDASFGDGESPYDLRFRVEDYGEDEGESLRVVVVSQADPFSPAGEGGAPIIDGAVRIDVPDVLDLGSGYLLAWYVDVNGNDSCDSPPTDHVWAAEMPAAEGDTEYLADWSADWTDVCFVFGGFSS
jgi:hypothetical protein